MNQEAKQESSRRRWVVDCWP